MPITQRGINELLPHLYAASCGEEDWTGFLSLLAKVAGTNRVHITYASDPNMLGGGPWHGTRQWIKHVGLTEHLLADAAKHAHADPWWLACVRGPFPQGWVGRGCDLRTIEKMAGTEHYEKVMRKHDFVRLAMAILLKRPGEVAACGLGRGINDEEFSDDVLELLRELTPHMRTAIRVFNKTGEVQQNLDSVEFALEQFAIAVFVLDNNGAIIFANAAAQRHIESRHNFTIENGKIKAISIRDSGRLLASINKAVLASEAAASVGPADRGIAVVPIAGKNGNAVHAFIAPWLTGRQLALRKPAAVMLVTQPGGRIPREAWLQTLYGLTKAESRVAVLVAEGLGGPEAAEELGVTPETIRTRLKTVFSKTNTRRQSDLARLLATLPHG